MNISHLKLEDHQLRLSMDAINRFGTGQHPTAQSHTIDGFYTDYLVECLDKATEHLTEKGLEVVDEIKTKIEETKKFVK